MKSFLQKTIYIILIVSAFLNPSLVHAEESKWYYEREGTSSDPANESKGYDTLSECTAARKDDTAKKISATCYTKYKLLAPIPGFDNVRNSTSLSDYLSTIYNLGLGIAAALSVVMIVIGGIKYATSEVVSSKEDGKQTIQNAIFGLVLALGSFVIIQTINPDLLNLNLGLSTVPIEDTSGDDIPKQNADGSYAGWKDSGKKGDSWKLSDNDPKSDQKIRAMLLEKGIGVNKKDCAEIGDSDCTSVRELPQRSIDALIILKEKCDCTVIVTGATEFWLHASHGPGKNIVDISPNTKLDNYISANNGFPLNCKGISKIGYMFTPEAGGYCSKNFTGKHWHAKF